MNYYELAPISHKLKLHDTATYECGQELSVGALVEVSYRRSIVPAVVINTTGKPRFKTKPIEKVIEHEAIPQDLLDLAQWLGHHYSLSLPQALQTILPRGITKKRRRESAGASARTEAATPPTLNHKQKRIVDDVTASPQTTHLLHGITGAGKTHIYIELLHQALAAGRDAMFLVPEIALTTHLLERIKPYFPDTTIALIHSQQSERERHLLWQTIKKNTRPVLVMGPRSAIFSPVKKLGMIIIDEAHDSSFKQQQTPHYDALHVAAHRAQAHNGKLVLGTATPDITTYYLTEHANVHLHTLPYRFHAQSKHRVELIDRRDQSNYGEDSFHLSLPLIKAIETATAHRQQSLLFINRRGFATSVTCTHCGWLLECSRCQLPMTYHKTDHTAHCHICSNRQSPPLTCPECKRADIRFRGVGTQRIEEELAQTFRQQATIRFDRDAKSDLDNEKLEQTDIIVGTQMVSKGFDLPRLSVVGVINADGPLYLPDYRAGETVYQQLTQIIGRNDRRGAGGKTLIQTAHPDHYAIQAAIHGDYQRFYQQELEHRRHGHYPPFTYLLKLTAQRKTVQGAQKLLMDIAADLRAISGLHVLGPSPSFYENAHGHKTWHLLLKSSSRSQLADVARKYRTGDVICELDPQNLL